MYIQHHEFSIFFTAPWDSGLCQYGVNLPCKNEGTMAIKIIDDRDQILKQYSTICSAHLLMAVLDQIVGV